jgi:hypothetical protein
MENAIAPVNFNNSPAEAQLPAVQMSASENAAIAMAAKQKAIVEAKYMMALARPRDYDKVRQDMLKDASRPNFANVAIYHKPVGKGVEGPSIRFVECALRNMRNIDTNADTISEDDERRIIRVSVTDLESNSSYSQEITVTKTVERAKLPQGEKPIRVRTNSYGKPVYILRGTDDDILNKQNALVSKAIRTLGLRHVPGEIVDEALEVVRKTMAKKDAADPDAAKNRIVDAFAQLGVSVESLKDYVGHELSALDPNELQTLRALYSAIKDGETTWKAVMDDKAEKDAEAKQATKNGKVAALKDAPKLESKKEPEQPAPDYSPTEVSSTTEDNDMFGD